MSKQIVNGAKSPSFRCTIKPNQMNGRLGKINKDLKKEMKKFYSKQRRNNFKQLDLI